MGLEQGVYGSPLIFLFHFSVNLNCSKKQSPLIIEKKKRTNMFPWPHQSLLQLPDSLTDMKDSLKINTELRRSHKFEPFFH